jgi:hypothetical protein
MKSRVLHYSLLLLLGVSICAGQQSAPPQPPNSSDELLLGQWKFNEDKSTRRGIESKSIIIERQGAAFKLTIENLSENGTHSFYSATTNLKGETVKTFTKDGKPTPQEWRVTREGANAFILNWSGPFPMDEKYEVDKDGKTITIRDVTRNPVIIGGKIDSNGKLVRVDLIEVFDKLPKAESK